MRMTTSGRTRQAPRAMNEHVRVQLVENGEPGEIDLPLSLGTALARTGFVDVNPVPETRQLWQLTPRSKVGAVSVRAPADQRGSRPATVEVEVAPKIRIDRLLFLMGYAHAATAWQDGSVEAESQPDLLLAVMESFERLAQQALRHGMLQGYRTVEEALPVVRGRIREADQLRRRFALPVPIEVRYDNYTVDIAENRVLRGAVERCLNHPDLPPRLQHRIQLLRRLFVDVTQGDPRAREKWFPSRLNTRYVAALRLADIILDASSFELGQGDVTVTGFVVDLAKIFEEFVCRTLTERLRAHSGYTQCQERWHLDRDRQVAIRPDLVWYGRDERPSAVIDAKYKAEKPGGFPDADLYQMLAYCTALRLPHGHLVYAKGNEQGRTHVITGTEITLHAHTLDLAQPPDRLLQQVDELAVRIIDTSNVRPQLLTRTGAGHD